MISKKLREEAAELGSLYASNQNENINGLDYVSPEAYELFWDTLSVLFDRMRARGNVPLGKTQSFAESWAETSAMLLNGDV